MKCKETFPTCLSQTDAKFSLLLMCVCCAPVSVETWQVAPGRDMIFIFYIKNQQDNSAPETNICRGPGARIFFGARIFIFYIKTSRIFRCPAKNIWRNLWWVHGGWLASERRPESLASPCNTNGQVGNRNWSWQ